MIPVCLVLCACAGFRGGWESIPYIGDTLPAPAEYRTPFEAQKRSELVLPGLTLGVGINNQVRTYDTQVYLFVLPLSVDAHDVHTHPVEPGKTRVTLRVVSHDGNFVFRPQLATLAVGTQRASGLGGFEFGMWDSSGARTTSGGTWDYRPTASEYPLTERGRTYLLCIDFPLPVPPPESHEISLDLSRALAAPGRPGVPTIHFVPMRWKEGYT